MPTNRSKRARQARRGAITAEAVAAYKACDDVALNDALGLPVWHPSPLEPNAPPLIAPPMDFDLAEAKERARRLADELKEAASHE